MEPRVAVEALRAGVVNRSVARMLTCGREQEATRLVEGITGNPTGSCQILVGGYGVGKTHLAEVVAHRLEGMGYAVARIEMGASHGRAENPRSVVHAIEQSLSVCVDGRRLRGVQDLAILIRALRVPRRPYVAEVQLLNRIHQDMPGRDRLLDRFDAIREQIPVLWGSAGRSSVPNLSIAHDVPSDMTAGNRAVAAVNGVAHDLALAGIRGVVLLFDEAERSEWASTPYRQSRARDLMLGFAMASANQDTSALKHHRNETWWSYCVERPSLLHSVFAFTHPWGLAAELARESRSPLWSLSAITESVRAEIAVGITRLYSRAYGTNLRLSTADRDHVVALSGHEDVRSFVRCVVAALDHQRRVRASNA